MFVNRKGLRTRDALLCDSHKLKNALKSEKEAGIVRNDFSAAFDRVNHKGILYITTALCLLEALCSLYYGHNFYQIDYSTLVGGLLYIGVNWLTLCQECHREVF